MYNSQNTRQHISFHLTNSSQVLNEEKRLIEMKENKSVDFKNINTTLKGISSNFMEKR